MAGLTKRLIDATHPEPGRDIRLWDDDPRGFGIRVKPSGVKTFFVQYTSPATFRKVRFTIGQYGRLTLEEARSEARKLLGQVEKKEDPAEALRQAKEDARIKARTIADLCDDYMRDARQGLVTYRGKPKKASTLDIDEGRIKRHIKPLLGERIVRDVARADVVAFLHDVRLGKTAATERTKPRGVARVTGGQTTANRAVDLLGSLFSYAVAHGLRPDNPVAGVDRLPSRKRDRVLSPDEYRALGSALAAQEAIGANPTAIRAIRVLALTGCRRNEVFGLRWSEVDAHNGCLRLKDTKAGQQVRPVGRKALDVMGEPPTKKGGAFVFPAAKGDGHLVDAKLFARVCEATGLEGVTIHTLRHGFASVALELEYSEMTIAGLLGHRSHSITARYAHHVDRALVAAADRVASVIAARMEGREAEGGQVIELPRRQRG